MTEPKDEFTAQVAILESANEAGLTNPKIRSEVLDDEVKVMIACDVGSTGDVKYTDRVKRRGGETQREIGGMVFDGGKRIINQLAALREQSIGRQR